MKLRNKYAIMPLTLATLPLASAGGQESERPNIILFMVDDMGWQDTSLPFWSERTANNLKYETPNMEALAAKGMKFTQAYAASISSPSRCSLITGMNAARHRVTNWTLEKDKSTDIASETIKTPNWNVNGITQSENFPHTFRATSFVQLLKENGYRTIHCGKAHFGAIGTPGADPAHFGFEVNIAGHAAGGLATYLSELNYGHNDDGTPTSPMAIPGLEKYWGSGVFATEALTMEALSALDMEKAGERPFFLYMSHYAVHIPIDKDPRFYEKYLKKGLSEKEAAYASLVEGMDKSLGDIMKWLEDNELDRKTILIFMSDNGGLATQPYWRDGEPYQQNAPLNCGKGSLYEGGVREPMIVYWPGITAPGSICNSYLMIEDFFPSILEMAGIERYRTISPVDGKSFVPLIKGTGDPSRGRSLVWNFPNIWGNSGPGLNLNCALRNGDWKLVYYYETGKKELFNIKEDISETKDVSEENPGIVRKLSRKLGRYLRSVDAQRPEYLPSGTPCPWPDGRK